MSGFEEPVHIHEHAGRLRTADKMLSDSLVRFMNVGANQLKSWLVWQPRVCQFHWQSESALGNRRG